MNMRFFNSAAVVGLAGLLTCAAVLAGPPMAFKESWMLMGEASSENKDVMLNYAFTARDSVGVGYHVWKGDGAMPGMRVAHSGLNYTHRLARWNSPDAQANLWLVVDAGPVKDALNFQGTRTGIMPSVQFDWETTRLYTMAYAGTLRAKGNVQYDTYKAQVGFSFYETQFDEWQPWLILEAKHMPRMFEKTEITPFLRVIHKSVYLEIGANTEGKPRVGLMKVFYF
jgi:hypothetical protein